jgi:hypothetical protein
MHLLLPIWLIGLVAVGIPVVIHLWQIRQGKTLKVGSIALFSESSPKSARSFKLADILLLLLRCLLLIVLALLLAAPFWSRRANINKTVGWILIPTKNFQETYHKFQPAIDSLKTKGYELHAFDPGFKKVDTTAVVINDSSSNNYWRLLDQLNDTVSTATPVELFTPNSLTFFEGTKPASGLNMSWHTYTPADSVKTWIADAWLTTNGDIRIARATATPLGINYQFDELKNGLSGPAYDLTINNGIPIISLKGSPSEKVKVDTTTRRIAIYTDKNNIDASYLKAALYAIAGSTKRKTVIRSYQQADAIPAGQDWLFWLTERPAGDAIIHKTKNLFSYAGGKAVDVTSWIINGAEQTKIDLYKEVPSLSSAGNAIWVNGFGKPVLSMTPGATNSYQFYTRFNPAWNDLVWNDDLPKWLLELTMKQPYGIERYERRIIDPAQLQTVHTSTTDVKRPLQISNIDLTHYLWLILAILFCVERWLATKNNKTIVNG